MRRLGGLAVIVGLALAAPAQAVVLVTPQGQPVGGKWQRWANESKVPTARIRIPFALTIPKACGNVDGCIGGKPVTIHIRPAARDARFALMHELGHAFDELYLTRIERHRFEYLDGWGHADYGYKYAPWSVHHTDPPGSPNEDFANTYASCAIYGLYPRTWYMNLWPNWDSNWASYRAACGLIRRVRY